MDFETLKKLFPTAIFHQENIVTPDTIEIETDLGHLKFPLDDITDREMVLLELFSHHTSASKDSEHLWYQILFGNKKVVTEGFYRIIHINLNSSFSFLEKAWKDEITHIFSDIVDFLCIDNNNFILIEKQSKSISIAADLEGIFTALDGDFDIYTRFFIGQFSYYKSDFSKIYSEEKSLFEKQLSSDSSKKVFNLSNSLIPFILDSVVSENYLLLSSYKQLLAENSERQKIVTSLWKNQGNVSTTAKSLYMHRNTLIYKLDNYYEESNLDLKNMDDLFLCYLLITHFSH